MDAEEKQAIAELRAMSREELEQVPHEVKKWVCQCKKCTRGTKVWDFGIAPLYYWPVHGGGWRYIPNGWLVCAKHNKLFKRLEKSFAFGVITTKLVDWGKQPILDIKPSTTVKKQKHVTPADKKAHPFF